MQPIPPDYMAYDRTIVVFSPEGRLLQVEYARQAVRRGATALGIKLKDCVILGATKTVSKLATAESYKKIHEVDTHVGLVSSGLLADARDLVELARVRAQINRITYGEPISVSSLTRYICNRKHLVTQYAGVRPYGVGLLIGGVDEDEARLYETDPSGTMIEWKAQAIGKGAERAKRVLERGYKDELSVEEGVKLVLKALKAAEKDVSVGNVEVVVIKRGKFKRLSQKESSKHM